MAIEAWQAAAAVRLAQRWQRAEEYRRAAAMHERVLEYRPTHSATLLNLSVCHLRLRQNDEALARLKTLNERLSSVRRAHRERWQMQFLADYNHALALHYADRGEEAREALLELCTRLEEVEKPGRLVRVIQALRRPLPTRDPRRAPAVRVADVHFLAGIEGSTLMLCAGELVTPGNAPGIARDLAEADVAPPRAELHALLKNRAPEPVLVVALVRFVRGDGADNGRVLDERARYNLACFGSRLCRFVSDERIAEAHRQRALEDLRFALGAPGLLRWAQDDPSLEILRSDPRWPAVIREAERARADGGDTGWNARFAEAMRLLGAWDVVALEIRLPEGAPAVTEEEWSRIAAFEPVAEGASARSHAAIAGAPSVEIISSSQRILLLHSVRGPIAIAERRTAAHQAHVLMLLVEHVIACLRRPERRPLDVVERRLDGRRVLAQVDPEASVTQIHRDLTGMTDVLRSLVPTPGVATARG